MNKPAIHIIALLFIISIGMSCAQYGNPQGGPKDTEAPYIIKESSDPNFQTNFTKKRIELVFNEWIRVSNPNKEVVVSPPTNYPPQIKEKGKSVIFEFSENEILKPNATYQINFGDAVRDFTEGNVYKNLIFVFSTGDEIDSLSISGKVTDANSGEPVSEAIVSLYDNLSDSCFLLEKPFYFTKTDKTGFFKLNNIRNDTFQIFTLKDENVNYYYDLQSEKVGFSDTYLILRDSSLTDVQLKLFDEEDKPRLVEYNQNYKGLIKVFYKPFPDSFQIAHIPDDKSDLYHEMQNDTLYIWHNAIASDSSSFSIKYDKTSDTITNKKAKKNIKKMALVLDKSTKKTIDFLQEDSLKILFNKPLSGILTDSVVVYDSTRNYPIRKASVLNRYAVLKIDSLKNKSNYNLRFLPGACQDMYGVNNTDTININIRTNDPEQYGNIVLNIVTDSDTTYIVNMMENLKLIKSVKLDRNSTIRFPKLSKGKYSLKIIEDTNNDGKWTPGNVVLKRHSEKIKDVTLEELKPGWDLELDVKIKEIFYGTTRN